MQVSDRSVLKLTVLAAAIGAGTAGQAEAQTTNRTISQAPTGFIPITFAQNLAQSISFNTDGVVGTDFTISSNGTNQISLIAPTATSALNSFAGTEQSSANPDSFVPVTNLKANTSFPQSASFVTDQSSSFAVNTPTYAEVATNVTRDASGNVLSGDLGYFNVTRTTDAGSNISSITINDYGRVAAVPEPATWALMTLGFGAAGTVLRRRRRAARRELAVAA